MTYSRQFAPRIHLGIRAAGAALSLASLVIATTALAITVASSPSSAVATSVNLGTAANYGVLAGQSVTNTGPSVINGDLGVSPGSAVTGFPPGTVNGVQHVTDAAALQAKADLASAYDAVAAQPSDELISADLAGRTLTTGVYTSDSTMSLSGQLILDAQGDSSAVFVFQVGSALLAATGSTITLTNGAQACNVFWQVGSSATLEAGSAFKGTILALTTITVGDAASIEGRLLARTGSVTLINDTITVPTCADVPTSDVPTSDVPTSDVPTSDVPTSDVPTSDVPTSDVPTSDVPTSDVPTSDVPTSDVPTSDVPTSDVPTSDVPTSDVRTSDVPTSESTVDTVSTVPRTGAPEHIIQLGLIAALLLAAGTTLVLWSRKQKPPRG